MFFDRWEKFLQLSALAKNSKKTINDVMSLNNLTSYWKERLLGICQSMFVWDGLPFPQRELENLLLLRGTCAIVKSDKFIINKIAAVPCYTSGVTEYIDLGTRTTWATPIASGKFKTIDGNGVLCRNDSLSNGLMTFLDRYALIFANVDISLICSLVNDRSQNVFVADSRNTADSVNEMFRGLEVDGKRKAVVNEKLFEALQGCVSLPMINSKDSLRPILEVYETILTMFYNDIGIRYNRNKKERMIDSEVTSDIQRLMINVNDMLHCRQDIVKEVNDKFGLNVSVKTTNDFLSQKENDKKDSETKTEKVKKELKEFTDYSF